MTISSDGDLLDQARAGDRDAIEALLAQHEPQIYRFALRMCSRPEDAREVLQETLLAAFKGLPTFRGEANLSTWLFQIARSFCTKARRTRAFEPKHHDRLESAEVAGVRADAATEPDAQAHAREVGAVLQAALASLPDGYREVLLLKDVEGLSADEVASVLGESVPAVKSRLHRARLELRRLLESVLGEHAPFAEPCPELAEELAGYAAGDIDRSTCEQMEAHMAHCARCAQACEQLKTTVTLCTHTGGDEVPAPIVAAVRQALRSARS